MPEAVLAMEGVSKSFGGLAVTQEVSLTVMPGEVHALIGPNGAGKTTLVSQIAGALNPDRGEIRFAGRDILGRGTAARARLGLARVFQISNVIASFSVLENVSLSAQATTGTSFSFWRAVAGEAVLAERAWQALKSVGLAERADIPAAVLSHGEKRALELAMCLVQEPKLLLLDEPMAGVGREETARLTELLSGLKGHVAMLLVEHDMGTVFALADRVTMLVGGAIAATGAPESMRSNPAVRKAYLGDEAA